MIKSVHVTALAKSPEDFKLLVKLLESLGLRKGFHGDNDNCSSGEFLPARLHLDVIYRKKPWDDTDVCLTVSDPDTAFGLIQRHGLKIEKDRSGPAQEHSVRSFRVKLPGGTRLMVLGPRVVDNVIDTNHLAIEGDLRGDGKRFGIVVSRFNSFITERLVAGALDGLTRCGAKLWKDIEIVRVPG